MKVRDIMSSPPVFVHAHTPIWRAARALTQREGGFLPVVENNVAIGVLTARDLAKRLDPEWHLSTTEPVSKIMTSPAIGICWNAGLPEAIEVMVKRERHRLVVVDERGILRGILTLRDLIPHLSPESICKALHAGHHPHVAAEAIWMRNLMLF